jgi:hypothetical protein
MRRLRHISQLLELAGSLVRRRPSETLRDREIFVSQVKIDFDSIAFVGQNRYMTTMILVVGLPGSGKTTVAKKLAREQNALRLTPDEWMIPLFGQPEADGKRDVLEGLMIGLALQLLRMNTGVVLDFGCWARDERAALRWLTEREEMQTDGASQGMDLREVLGVLAACSGQGFQLHVPPTNQGQVPSSSSRWLDG